jgi:hypothetical protein
MARDMIVASPNQSSKSIAKSLDSIIAPDEDVIQYYAAVTTG